MLCRSSVDAGRRADPRRASRRRRRRHPISTRSTGTASTHARSAGWRACGRVRRARRRRRLRRAAPVGDRRRPRGRRGARRCTPGSTARFTAFAWSGDTLSSAAPQRRATSASYRAGRIQVDRPRAVALRIAGAAGAASDPGRHGRRGERRPPRPHPLPPSRRRQRQPSTPGCGTRRHRGRRAAGRTSTDDAGRTPSCRGSAARDRRARYEAPSAGASRRGGSNPPGRRWPRPIPPDRRAAAAPGSSSPIDRPLLVDRVHRRQEADRRVDRRRRVPSQRSRIHFSTRMLSPKPGHRNLPSAPVRNQLTRKILRRLRHASRRRRASAGSSRPCCSRRTAASPSGRGAARRPCRSPPRSSRTTASRRGTCRACQLRAS